MRGNFRVFTICNKRYLPQALLGVQTFASVAPTCQRLIVLVDSAREYEFDGITILPMAPLLEFAQSRGVGEGLEILEHYTVTSLCTAIKPLALWYLQQASPARPDAPIVYIDPDSYWLSPPDFNDCMEGLSFFRHRDKLYLDTHFDGSNFLTHGGLNLGLIIDAGADLDLLQEWFLFALPINFESPMLGFYTDQRPADQITLSGRARAHYKPAVNLSYWNIGDVELTSDPLGGFRVRQDGVESKLSMFHFSGFRPSIEGYSTGRLDAYRSHPNVDVIQKLHQQYEAALVPLREKVGSLDLETNAWGTSSVAGVYRFLIEKRHSGRRSLVSRALRAFNAVSPWPSQFVSRFYRMSNPFKI
jgi:hypothetical protein